MVSFAWSANGRTSLRNWSSLGTDWRKPPKGGATGSFSLRSTWRKAAAMASAMDVIHKVYQTYLITHTMPVGYDNAARRMYWRRFLDRIRKENPVSYFWITERHEGNGPSKGLIHHHMTVAFPRKWYYSKLVRGWSETYSRSVNGLDIQLSKGSSGGYCGKYLSKGMAPMTGCLGVTSGQSAWDTLPFRWWGSSGLVASGFVHMDKALLYEPHFRSPWYARREVWLPTREVAKAIACDSVTQFRQKYPLLCLAAKQQRKKQYEPVQL